MDNKKYYIIQGILNCITVIATLLCLFFVAVALTQNNISINHTTLNEFLVKVMKLWLVGLILSPVVAFIAWFVKKKIEIYKIESKD